MTHGKGFKYRSFRQKSNSCFWAWQKALKVGDNLYFCRKQKKMHAFNAYYFFCPSCHAILAGKTQEMLGINFTELYSDGKMLCDELLAEPQLLVCCPSCSHLFWRPDEVLSKLPDEVQRESKMVYPYSSWYLFGADGSKTEGKKALITRCEKYLLSLRPMSAEQEFYLRKSLLWAINDLVRDYDHINFLAIFKKEFGFRWWLHNRGRLIAGRQFFLAKSKIYDDNIKRLIELVRSLPEKEADRVYLAELYRLKGNFVKSLEVLDKLNRATYYAEQIRRRVRAKNPTVFKVAG